MPATSRAMQMAMAIAEHHPDQLYARNKGLLKMSHQQLHDFAATSTKDLPLHHAMAHKALKHGHR